MHTCTSAYVHYMYMHIHTRTCIRVCTPHTCVHVCTCINASTCVHIFTCVCACTCIHAWMCLRAYACIHAYAHAHAHMHTYIYMHTCICIYAYVRKHALPSGNLSASALGEDPFIPLNTHMTRKSKSKTKAQFIPMSARKST